MDLRQKNTTLDLRSCYLFCSATYMHIPLMVVMDNILEKVKNILLAFCSLKWSYVISTEANPLKGERNGEICSK